MSSYTCDGCGKIGHWDQQWSSFGSLAMEETCPDDMPTVCSDKCREILKKKIESGEIRLPVLRLAPSGHYWIVSKKRVGY